MSAAAADGADRALCVAAARWLSAAGGAAGTLGLASLGFAALLLVAREPGPAIAVGVLLLAPLERLLALRVRFDAGLFADLGRGALTLSSLDASLHGLRLRGPAAAPRALADRVDGARALVWRHVAVAMLQFALVTMQAAHAAWSRA